MSTPERDIEAVLRESGPEYEKLSYRRPTAGHQGEVFLVTITRAGEQYEVVIKFQAGDPQFALEPFLHEYVADRTDVPVPRILVFKEDPELDVEPYFVTERVEGRNLAEAMQEQAFDDAAFAEVIEHAGEILGAMHSEIGFEGFGRLALEGERLIVDEFSWDWQAFFRGITENHIDALVETPFEDLQEEARSRLEASIDVVDSDGIPRLVHDDFRPANMLYDPSGERPISAVLDWQFALAGDPEYHVARTEFLFIDPTYGTEQTRENLREHLYNGYRTHREFEPDENYKKRRIVYQFATLLWRMSNFDAAFAEYSDLQRTRAKHAYRTQFDTTVGELPTE